jgi:hypothetical protein
MTEFDNLPVEDRPYNGQLEAYLDGVMAEGDRALLESKLKQNPQLSAEVALQSRLDSALTRAFPVVTPSPLHLAALEKHWNNATSDAEPTAIKIHWPWVVGIASAAAAACLVFALWMPGTKSYNKPHFEPTPLAQIYTQTVREGFEPYYECRDDARFADTFAKRQGIALQLTKLPLGSTMKGLSYPGGLSRETTAMLCDVKGQHVMVFVDREEKDQAVAAKKSDPQLNVFRAERDGLVFYEVTPLEKPTMTEHLVVVKN